MVAILDIAESCVHCGICVKECKFLQVNGTPGKINSAYNEQKNGSGLHLSYSCNLCGLCDAVCPLKLQCSQSFLDIRRKEAAQNVKVHKKHKSICNYVKIGSSKLFSLDLLPAGCDTVFFPGCTLSATRASTTEKTYKYLQQHIKNLGIVLDCCSKPTRDLGRGREFQHLYGRLVERIQNKGVKKIISGCPSCFVTFKEYSPDLEVEMVYETLANHLPEISLDEPITYALHDACATRYDDEIHESVRYLTRSCGLELYEMTHSRRKAICCGEGGAAMFVSPDIAGNWKDIRGNEVNGNKVITYCAGCSSRFGKSFDNTHLLDLLFFPQLSVIGKEKIRKAPFTYMSRYRLKKRLLADGNGNVGGKTKFPSMTFLGSSLFICGILSIPIMLML